MESFCIILQQDLIAGVDFILAENVMFCEQLYVFVSDELRNGVRQGLQVVKSAAGGLFYPFIGVTISIKQDLFMIFDHSFQKFLDSIVKPILRHVLQGFVYLIQSLGHCRVQDNIGLGNRQGASRHTELKLISGKGKRRCTVPVRGILCKMRQYMSADLHQCLLLLFKIGSLLNRAKHGGQLISEENRDDSRRRLVSSKPVIVAGTCHGYPHQICIFVHSLDDS